VFTFSTDDAEFVFRMVDRDGRLFITEMLRPRPRAAAFLGAVRAKLAALGTYPWDLAALPSAAQQVSRERPDLVPDEEDVEHVIRCSALRACGR